MKPSFYVKRLRSWRRIASVYEFHNDHGVALLVFDARGEQMGEWQGYNHRFARWVARLACPRGDLHEKLTW